MTGMMQWNTPVAVEKPGFLIEPFEEILFVGSCFADGIGRRFQEEQFRATVNPYGTMYNPASVIHTIERTEVAHRVAFITLSTKHVYILKETGEIVDNCQKRPARLFEERELSVTECADYLRRCVEVLRARRSDVQIVFTVSPIRYAKYGFHGSQLSKATLLLAVQEVVREAFSSYFPAYEIVLDELRDYRFYAPDMIHPSEQAVEYVFQRLADTYFSDATKRFLEEWRPVKEALRHRPLHPESSDYQAFRAKVNEKIQMLKEKYPLFTERGRE